MDRSETRTVPLADVIALTEGVKQVLIANYPHAGKMFFSFGANRRAVELIDGWALEHGLTALEIAVRTDSGRHVTMGPLKTET